MTNPPPTSIAHTPTPVSAPGIAASGHPAGPAAEDSASPARNPNLNHRFERIEEVVSFNERSIEDIHDQLFQLHERLDALSSRLDRLEHQANKPADDTDPGTETP